MICCNKTKSVQIVLSHISNVMICGIEIENCGVSDTFTLALSYSNTVTIQLLTLTHCKGISLKIENLKEMLSLRNSTFIHNQANLYVFIPSFTNEALHENKTIMIYSSIFLSGKYCVRNPVAKTTTRR